jgi:hypothetical protein
MGNDATRPILSICQRILAAVWGGYALATLSSIVLAGLLPVARADAVLAASLLSFAIYTGTILWAFAARTVLRAWVGILVPVAILSVLAYLIVWWVRLA